MKRISIQPRQNWEEKIQDVGFLYYKDYYNEQNAYTFSLDEINKIEKATNEIFDLCIRTVDFIVEENLLQDFKIPSQYHEIIKKSWKEDHISFYGRFDLGYNSNTQEIKLLEFNADTPTSLVEASIVQWFWLQDFNDTYDQFNSIHDRLVAHMKTCHPYLLGKQKVFFSSVSDSQEDYITTKYLEDCAHQAGILTSYLPIHEISLGDGSFCTPQGEMIENIFKLYPYEWMFHEEFGEALISNFDFCTWIEPFYKSIMSNKMFMVYLSRLFPDSPYILKCQTDPEGLINYVKKPLLSREGANIEIIKNGMSIEKTEGDYGEEGFVYQDYFELPVFDGQTPILGSWLIGGEAAGLGIRESSTLITTNTSRFVPHFII
ncbi:glutathionylspermidine synthase family protein [Amniculibacterium sp. G2-70]|uniref:glutathionylspermidine synthase family protein n=1 Tax=Amniculibacterium sp. G2-70 TaxID=2767188 RepID=UPI001654B2B5|nr:glutathionylspermidine synthase family protein [Amniculibacterium sp. G2-70]